MDKYYHFTSFNNLPSIMKCGLVPQTGFRCYSIQDNSYGVFLSKGIDKAIQMFAFMLSYYNKVTGIEGDKVIQECLKEIEEENKKNPYFQNILNINECNYTINRINTIRACGSFDRYLGENMCYLSIEGITPNEESHPSNCRYDGRILPDKIKLVGLRNINTNECTYNLYSVLSYFMHIYPMNAVLKSVSENNHNDIKKLYEYKNNNFSLNNYELIEVPLINSYNYQKIITTN